MDAYLKIINCNQLYPYEIIEQFAKRHSKWYQMNSQEKEALLLHIMVCVLLCNREKFVEGKPYSSKRPASETPEKSRPKKILKMESTTAQAYPQPGPSTSKATYQESSSSTCEIDEDETLMEESKDHDIQDFRFQMINYMPMRANTIKEVLTSWRLGEVTYQWDIADIETKKLIMVRYSSQPTVDHHHYLRAKTEIPNNCDMFVIVPGQTKGTWVDGNKEALGESKVTKFLVARSILFEQMGINDTFAMSASNVDNLLPSVWLKEELSKWEVDLLRDQNAKLSSKELYIESPGPDTLTPMILLENLQPILETECAYEAVLWKGKLLPESFSLNIETTMRTDEEMITLFLTHITSHLENLQEVRHVNMKEDSALTEEVLNVVMDVWKDSNKNTFSFTERAAGDQMQTLKNVLGIGRIAS